MTNTTTFQMNLTIVFFSNSVPGVVVVLLSFKLDFGFIHPYFSVVKRWSFYVSVSLCTLRCTMYDDNDDDDYYCSCCCCCQIYKCCTFRINYHQLFVIIVAVRSTYLEHVDMDMLFSRSRRTVSKRDYCIVQQWRRFNLCRFSY